MTLLRQTCVKPFGWNAALKLTKSHTRISNSGLTPRLLPRRHSIVGNSGLCTNQLGSYLPWPDRSLIRVRIAE
jgi:hypothetical protein